MANLSIVIVARNMASGALRELHGELGGLDTQAGVATRGITGLQGAVRAGLAAAAAAGTVAVGALGAGMIAAANKAGDFEAQINILGVAARQSGTGMDDLRAAAMRVGSDVTLVGISSSEAADAMTNFYRAGMTTTDVFGDLQGYLAGTVPLSGALRASIDLAAASELDLAAASNVVSVAMATFGLEAGDATGIANSLVGAADASQASVGGLAEALQNVGPVAAQMGMSLNDTNIALALLSTRGIEGSEAGTSLRSMLLNLTSGSDTTTAALQALNVSLYDQAGNMRSLPDIIGQLQTAFSGLTQEQQTQYAQTLAGTYGLRALNTLVGEGVPGWDAMATAVANAATAQEVAAARTQGFNAAMENLGGVIETFLISVGTPLIQNFLTPGIQWLSQWISSLTTLAPTTDQVSAAFQTLLDYGLQMLTWIQSTVGPIVEVIAQFVSWQDVLIVLAGVVASIVIPAIAGIVTAVAPVILVFGALVAAVALVRTAWEENWGGIRDTVTTIVTAITGFLQTLASYIQTHSGQVTGWLTTAWQQIQTIVGAVVNAISSIVSTVLGAVASFIQAHGQEIVAFLAGAWEQIGRIVNLALQVLQATVVPVLQAIANFIQAHSADIQRFLETAWVAIRTIIETVLGVIEGLIRTVLAVIRGDWDTAWTSLQGVVDTALNGIVTLAQTLLTPLVDFIRDRLTEIRNWFETKWNEAKMAVETKIAEILASIRQWLQDTASAITSFDLRAAARELFQKVIAGIADKVGEALAAVANFLDDVFVAIESFDLREAARTFFGTTLPGIGEKITEALQKVGDWLSDTAQRIQGYDLRAAARTFFGTTLPGIGEKITEALRKVAEWLNDTADKISSFDLKEAAKTLFGTILPGLLAKAGEILREVGNLLRDIANRISEKSFKSETMTAIGTMIAGILQKIGDALSAIGGLLQAIANAIRGFSLADVGRALIEGLIGGIQSMAGSLVDAARGVVQSAIDAARNLLGIQSPSTVFYEIGENMLLGLMNAITELTPEVVNTIADSISRILGAFQQLAQVVPILMNPPADLSGVIDAWRRQIVLIVRALVQVWNNWREHVQVGIAAQMADDLVRIFAPWEAAAAAVAVIAAGPAGNLSGVIDAWRHDIVLIVRALVQVWNNWQEHIQTGIAAQVADDLVKIFAPWEAAAAAVAVIMTGPAGDIRPVIDTWRQQIVLIIDALLDIAAELGTNGVALAAQVGEQMSSILDPWAAAVEVVGVIAAATLADISAKAPLLAQQMQALAAALAVVANELGPEALQLAATAGEQLASVLEPWQAGVEVMSALAGYTATIVGPAAETLKNQMMGLASKLRWLALELGPEAMALAATAGEQLASVLEPWQAGVEVMSALAGYTATQVGPAAEALKNQMMGLASKLRHLANELGPEAMALAATAGQQLSAMLEPWEAGIDVMSALASYTATQVGPAAQALVDQMVVLVEALQTAAERVGTDALDAAVAFAEAAGTVGENIADALEGLGALLGYQGGLAQTSLDAFVADMLAVVAALAEAATQIYSGGLDAAVQLATAAGEIGTKVGDAIEGLSALLDYQGGLATTSLAAFVGDMTAVVTALAAAAAALNQNALASALVFLNAAGDVTELLSEAVESLTTALEYEGGQAQAAMTAFVGDINTVVTSLAAAATQLAGAGVSQAQAIATAGSQIQQQVLAGLNAMLGIPGSVGGLNAALLQLLELLSFALATMGVYFDDLLDAAWEFGYGWIGHIIAGINSRLPDLVAVLNYLRGLFPSSPAKWGPFRKLPEGSVVGTQFGRDVARGLRAEVTAVSQAADLIKKAMLLGQQPQPPQAGDLLQYDVARRRQPPVIYSGGDARRIGPPITVTISNNTFGARDDVDYLLNELDRRLRLQGAYRRVS